MSEVLDNKVQYLASIPVDLLKVDYSYQKPLTLSHVRKIVNNFNETSVGQIHVSKRDDGSFYIFDGQHRWTAHKQLDIPIISCVVYEGLTIEEEAIAYNAYNTIKSQNALDRERALIVAQDPMALERKRATESIGLEIDYQRRNLSHTLRAMNAIQRIHEQFGTGRLIKVLLVAKESYGIKSESFQAFILQSINDLLDEYGSVIDPKWLVKKLREYGLDELLIEQQTFRRAFNCDRREATKYAMIKFYNHRKRKGKLQ